jgi:AraC-like DNA-binding protein
MEIGAFPIDGNFLKRFNIYNVRDPDELLYGAHIASFKKHSKCYVYRPASKGWQTHPRGQVLSAFGMGNTGELDLSYVAGRYGTSIAIVGDGLPYYCLSTMISGRTEYQPAGRAVIEVASERMGLIYRGTPGSRFRTTDNNDRLNIWLSGASLERRLVALLGGPLHEPIAFDPAIDWLSAGGQRIRRLIRNLCDETATPQPFLGNDLARGSFEDLFFYSLLLVLRHNYSDRLAQLTRAPAPRIVRRAEAFMHAHAGQSLALHEIAEAAGCSVRSLQTGFRRFRGTTPLAAMRSVRLQAVRQALIHGEVAGSLGELAKRYGFTNRSRFARDYEVAFGQSPVEALGVTRAYSGARGITRPSCDTKPAGCSG